MIQKTITVKPTNVSSDVHAKELLDIPHERSNKTSNLNISVSPQKIIQVNEFTITPADIVNKKLRTKNRTSRLLIVLQII